MKSETSIPSAPLIPRSELHASDVVAAAQLRYNVLAAASTVDPLSIRDLVVSLTSVDEVDPVAGDELRRNALSLLGAAVLLATPEPSTIKEKKDD